MKPIQIGLLVLVGALGGALIMKFTQRPRPVPVPIASAAPAATPVVSATIPEDTPEPKPTALPEEAAPVPAPKKAKAVKPAVDKAVNKAVNKAVDKPVKMGHHTQPMLRIPQAPATVAQSRPPAQPEPPEPQADRPEPAQVQATPAPPVASEPPVPAISAPVSPAESAQPPAPQPAPSVTLQAGMTLPVSLGENLSSEHNQAGDTFTATLTAPLSAGGFVIAERGARVEGHVIEAQKSGHAKGKATLALELTSVNTSDGQHVAIKTEILRKQGTTMATQDQVGAVAAAAGIGAIIGAMAGGGKGAAIGAGAGGAAGGGGVVAARDKPVTLPTESKITFRLSAPVTVTEQVNR